MLSLRNPRPLAYAQLRLTGLLDVFALAETGVRVPRRVGAAG